MVNSTSWPVHWHVQVAKGCHSRDYIKPPGKRKREHLYISAAEVRLHLMVWGQPFSSPNWLPNHWIAGFNPSGQMLRFSAALSGDPATINLNHLLHSKAGWWDSADGARWRLDSMAMNKPVWQCWSSKRCPGPWIGHNAVPTCRWWTLLFEAWLRKLGRGNCKRWTLLCWIKW